LEVGREGGREGGREEGREGGNSGKEDRRETHLLSSATTSGASLAVPPLDDDLRTVSSFVSCLFRAASSWILASCALMASLSVFCGDGLGEPVALLLKKSMLTRRLLGFASPVDVLLPLPGERLPNPLSPTTTELLGPVVYFQGVSSIPAAAPTTIEALRGTQCGFPILPQLPLTLTHRPAALCDLCT
jgi:hypothetical protein